MKITILTLFPNMFTNLSSESIIKRAIEMGAVEINIVDIRDYSLEKHHKVDDTPYGGGAGMVMQVDVVHRAIMANKNENTKVLMMTPQGDVFNQTMASKLSLEKDLLILCGHYEGFDERIRSYVDFEISIGDYVLTGGEIPAMVISDAVIRLLDGVIEKESHADDSFSNGLIEYPHYTRPYEYDGMKVPDVLVNGNHKLINEFRHKESLRRTFKRRPDLLEKYELSSKDKKILDEIKSETK